jgi:hypothetical protein
LRSTRSMTPAAVHQCLIDLTIFLPTPRVTKASSRLNRFGSSCKYLTPFGNQEYLNGKVSWPLKPYATLGRGSDDKKLYPFTAGTTQVERVRPCINLQYDSLESAYSFPLPFSGGPQHPMPITSPVFVSLLIFGSKFYVLGSRLPLPFDARCLLALCCNTLAIDRPPLWTFARYTGVVTGVKPFQDAVEITRFC